MKGGTGKQFVTTDYVGTLVRKIMKSVGGKAGANSGSVITDHGLLSGLLDDDHPQYLKADGSRPLTDALQLPEIATPATPGASEVKVYAKSDHKVYRKDSTGTEAELGGGGGSTPTGTGFRHVTSGAEDEAAKLVVNADVDNAAAIAESKLALAHATHDNSGDPTADQKAALAGTSGTPSASNKYVTNADSRNADSRAPTAHNILSAAHGDTLADSIVAGDILYGNATPKLARLPKGADGKILKLVSGLPSWETESGGSGPTLEVPQTIPGLCDWFCADKIAGLSDGNDVHEWRNSAGAPYYESAWPRRGSGSGFPIYKTGILNGLPVVRIDGTTYLCFQAPFWGPNFTFFIVFKLANLSPGYGGLIGQGWTSDQGGFFIKSDGKAASYMGYSQQSYPADGTGAQTFNATNWNYLTGVYGQPSYFTRRNGSADIGATTWLPVPGYGDQMMLGNHSVGGRNIAADFAEVIFYSTVLTSTEVAAVEAYLAAKYGL